MKTSVLILYQNIVHLDALKQGIAQAQKLLSNATKGELTLEVEYQETKNQYSTVVYPNVTCVRPEQIMTEARASEIRNRKEYNIACLVYDWDKVGMPKPTNPVQNGVLYEGFTIIQLPENWYSDGTVTPRIAYPEVCAQFFLHEIVHAFYFLTNTKIEPDLPDKVHGDFGSLGFTNPTDYYLSLINQLKPYWPYLKAATVSKPQDPQPTTPTDPNVYVVKAGDTLSSIAKKFNMTLQHLISLNPKYVKNPNSIAIGDKVNVVAVQPPPVVTPPVEQPKPDLSGKLTDAILLALQDYNTQELSIGHNEKIIQYFADTGNSWVKDDETAWCAAFVGSCLERAKIGSTKSLAARSYTKWGKETTMPKLGDIVVFQRPEAGPDAGHVAFFIRKEGTNVMVLGGNQSNSVSIANYPLSRVIAYRTK